MGNGIAEKKIKIWKKCSKYCQFFAKLDHNTDFKEKRHFCRKMLNVLINPPLGK
jgi:hypothetical protein